MKWKTKNKTSEQLQNQIKLSWKQATLILLTCIKLVLWAQNAFLVNNEVMQVFSASGENSKSHTIRLELESGSTDR